MHKKEKREKIRREKLNKRDYLTNHMFLFNQVTQSKRLNKVCQPTWFPILVSRLEIILSREC